MQIHILSFDKWKIKSKNNAGFCLFRCEVIWVTESFILEEVLNTWSADLKQKDIMLKRKWKWIHIYLRPQEVKVQIDKYIYFPSI